MAKATRRGNLSDRLAPKVVLLWAGVSIGVAFLATPAKFLAATLSLPVALEVGRQTFRVYNWAELSLVLFLGLLGLCSGERRRWLLRLSGPSVIVVLQALWLIPELDQRLSVIQAGGRLLQPSHHHSTYIAAEALKVVWLIVVGLSTDLFDPRPSAPRARRSSWIPVSPAPFPPRQTQ